MLFSAKERKEEKKRNVQVITEQPDSSTFLDQLSEARTLRINHLVLKQPYIHWCHSIATIHVIPTFTPFHINPASCQIKFDSSFYYIYTLLFTALHPVMLATHFAYTPMLAVLNCPPLPPSSILPPHNTLHLCMRNPFGDIMAP